MKIITIIRGSVLFLALGQQLFAADGAPSRIAQARQAKAAALRQAQAELADTAATEIQAEVRGKLAKNKVTQMRRQKKLENDSATAIQKIARAKAARKVTAGLRQEKAQQEAATNIQRIARGHKAKKEAALLRQEAAAKKVQAAYRSHVKMVKAKAELAKLREEKKQNLAAKAIQKVYRGHAGRELAKEERTKHDTFVEIFPQLLSTLEDRLNEEASLERTEKIAADLKEFFASVDSDFWILPEVRGYFNMPARTVDEVPVLDLAVILEFVHAEHAEVNINNKLRASICLLSDYARLILPENFKIEGSWHVLLGLEEDTYADKTEDMNFTEQCFSTVRETKQAIKARDAAIKIEAVGRGYIAKKAVERMRAAHKNEAATEIQKIYRGSLARKNFPEFKRVATVKRYVKKIAEQLEAHRNRLNEISIGGEISKGDEPILSKDEVAFINEIAQLIRAGFEGIEIDSLMIETRRCHFFGEDMSARTTKDIPAETVAVALAVAVKNFPEATMLEVFEKVMSCAWGFIDYNDSKVELAYAIRSAVHAWNWEFNNGKKEE